MCDLHVSDLWLVFNVHSSLFSLVSTSDGWSTYRVFQLHRADFHLICFIRLSDFPVCFFFVFKITMNYFFYSTSLCWLTRIRSHPFFFLNKVVVTELLSWLAVCQSLYFIISLLLSPAPRSDLLNSSPSRLQPLGWKSLPHCAEPCLWTSGLYRAILLNTFSDRTNTTEILIRFTQ